jgi:hypothetical protein
MRVLPKFRNLLQEIKSGRYLISLALMTSAALLILVSPATVYLPASFTYLGPVNWDSKIADDKSLLYVSGERQNNNELVIEGSITANETLGAQTVIANFASRESGLQLFLEPNPNEKSNGLYLRVRDDLPFDILGDCPTCGVPTWPIYIGELDGESNSHNLLVHIRNTPPVIDIEFDSKAVTIPSEIYPENIDLSVSQVSLGNKDFLERSEAVSVNDFRVSFSSDIKKIEVKNLALILLMIGIIFGVIAYSKPRAQ